MSLIQRYDDLMVKAQSRHTQAQDATYVAKRALEAIRWTIEQDVDRFKISFGMFGTEQVYSVPVDKYHSLVVLESGEIAGRNGAFLYLLDQEGNPKTKEGYHDIRRLKNGALVGGFGSVQCLLDEEGNPKSEPYMSIRPGRNGRYYARSGSMRYTLDKDGKVLSQGIRQMKKGD